MTYLETHTTNPTYNLAFEVWVLTHLTEDDYLILWQNENTVVIGQNQNALEEINADFVRAHGITLVRRSTGGGAVYHDLGNLNFSFITDYDQQSGTDMSRFTSLVVDALSCLGVQAEASGRNDILVDGKKVSGTAQRIVKVKTPESGKGSLKEDAQTRTNAAAAVISRERILYHGTLLFRSDPDMIAGALHADPLKFTSKSTKSVRSRVGNIADYLPEEKSLSDFWNAIKNLLQQRQLSMPKAALPEERANLSKQKETTVQEKADMPKETTTQEKTEIQKETKLPIDYDAIRKLQKEKYESYDWTYGRSPAFSFQKKKRFPGGTLQLRLTIEKGLITDASIYGDFLSLLSTETITESLKNIPYTTAAMEKALKEVDFDRILGSISREEFFQLLH